MYRQRFLDFLLFCMEKLRSIMGHLCCVLPELARADPREPNIDLPLLTITAKPSDRLFRLPLATPSPGLIPSLTFPCQRPSSFSPHVSLAGGIEFPEYSALRSLINPSPLPSVCGCSSPRYHFPVPNVTFRSSIATAPISSPLYPSTYCSLL